MKIKHDLTIEILKNCQKDATLLITAIRFLIYNKIFKINDYVHALF